MVAHHAWAVIRSLLFWGIPVVLVAALVWTVLPRGHPASPAAAPPAPQTSAPPRSAASPTPSESTPPASERADMDPSAKTGSGAKPFAEIHQGDLEGTDETGRQQWRVVADSVTVVHNKDAVLLRNVRATFYERDGGTIVVTGARGRFDTKTHEVEVDGNVHGKSSTGRELFADALHWLPRPGQITGTGHIRFIQERVVMYADGMTSDTTLGRTKFFGHVRAAVR